MKKIIFALATAAVVAAGTLTAPTSAQAACRGCWVGGAIVGGAILGAAVANSHPRYYAPGPGYVVYEGYGAPYPAACPGGYWARKPLHDRWGNFVGWSKPRFVCP